MENVQGSSFCSFRVEPQESGSLVKRAMKASSGHWRTRAHREFASVQSWFAKAWSSNRHMHACACEGSRVIHKRKCIYWWLYASCRGLENFGWIRQATDKQTEGATEWRGERPWREQKLQQRGEHGNFFYRQVIVTPFYLLIWSILYTIFLIVEAFS